MRTQAAAVKYGARRQGNGPWGEGICPRTRRQARKHPECFARDCEARRAVETISEYDPKTLSKFGVCSE